MENSNQLSQRFKELLLSGTWIANTNYKASLSSVTLRIATQKIESLNTIATLTFHVNYYIEGLLNVFKGGTLDIKDKYSFDAPELESEDDWIILLNAMWTNAEEFAKHVELMTDEKLDSCFVKKEYGTYRRNIEGIIEHSYYHLGQISLLKKMCEN